MVSIDWSNTGAIDVEMDGSQFLTKNHLLRYWC